MIRGGDFYECFGWNAVWLVAHAGLNPMGNTGVPRAGCPNNKIQETLDRLTSQGHSVVVCEEVPQMVKYGTLKAPPKDRFVSAIVTPASPMYVCGAGDRGEDVNFADTQALPLCAVASSSLGYTLIRALVDERVCRVDYGLTAGGARQFYALPVVQEISCINTDRSAPITRVRVIQRQFGSIATFTMGSWCHRIRGFRRPVRRHSARG